MCAVDWIYRHNLCDILIISANDFDLRQQIDTAFLLSIAFRWLSRLSACYSQDYSLAQPWTCFSLKYNVWNVSVGGTSRVDTRAGPPLPIQFLKLDFMRLIASGKLFTLSSIKLFSSSLQSTQRHLFKCECRDSLWTQFWAHRNTRVIRNNSSSTH